MSVLLLTLTSGTFISVAGAEIKDSTLSTPHATMTAHFWDVTTTSVAKTTHGQLVADDVVAILTGIANAPGGAGAVNDIMGVRMP